MQEQPPKTRNLVDRLLLRWANRDLQGGARAPLLLTTAVRKLVSGDSDAAGRYIWTVLSRRHRGDSQAIFKFPQEGYLARLLESEKKDYLRSAVKIVQYSFPRWEDTLCVIQPGSGDLVEKLEAVGYSNCEGLTFDVGDPTETLHRRVREVRSLWEAGRSYRTVAAFNVLEYLEPREAEFAINQISKLAEEFVVASIAIYPDQLLDFFDRDSSRKTLRSRSWWDQLFSRNGFEAVEPPYEELPHVTPFLYRRRRLGGVSARMREMVNGAQTVAEDPLVPPQIMQASPDAVFVLPRGRDAFRSASRALVHELRAEMFPSRVVAAEDLSDSEVAKAPFKITWSHYRPEYRRIQINGGRQLEFFATDFQLQRHGPLTGWLHEMQERPSLKLVPSAFCKEVLKGIGVPSHQVEIVPYGYSPEFSREKVTPLPLATHKSFRLLAVVNSDDPFRFGVDLLLKAYRSEFKASDDICLVIKDYGSRPSVIQSNLKPDGGPETLFYANFLSKHELTSLYGACSALVAPFRGEGFGVKILDAAALGLPLILPLYGGPVDYCPKHLIQHVSYKMRPVEGSAEAAQGRWKEKLSWCEPDVGDLAEQMRWVFEHQQDARHRSAALRERTLQEFSWRSAAQKLLRLMQI